MNIFLDYMSYFFVGLSSHFSLSRGSQSFDLSEVVSVAMLGIPVCAFGHCGGENTTPPSSFSTNFFPESEEMTLFLGTVNSLRRWNLNIQHDSIQHDKNTLFQRLPWCEHECCWGWLESCHHIAWWLEIRREKFSISNPEDPQGTLQWKGEWTCSIAGVFWSSKSSVLRGQDT